MVRSMPPGLACVQVPVNGRPGRAGARAICPTNDVLDWAEFETGGSAMDITIVCIPYQMDVARWGYALGPQAFLDQGLGDQLRARGHHVRPPVWIDLPAVERTRDTVTNLGLIAARTADAVHRALRHDAGFALLLEGDCTHAVGAIGGLATAMGTPGVVWI